MKEIVEMTGMSKGAFYHYFNSKEQVFAEVIDHFVLKAMTTDYDKFSKDSLKGFYTDILEDYYKNTKVSASLVPKSKEKEISNNYFYLIFDAMRLLPDFKEKHALQQKNELQAWIEVSGNALVNSEIKTHLTAEIVSKLFINLGDGTNLKVIMENQTAYEKSELKTLWDGLYESLKA